MNTPFPCLDRPLAPHDWIIDLRKGPDAPRICAKCEQPKTLANQIGVCPGKPGAPQHTWRSREFDHPDHPGDLLQRQLGHFCARCGVRNHELAASRDCPECAWERADGAPIIEAEPSPIPMLLWCPECGERHIDVGVWATKAHHTHSCQGCGMTWRPAVVATTGVRFLPGFKNQSKERLQ
jgi:predicted RNA-binding Zn-ribbon protein involved in translation (DUF1610 family)